jgi:hypothetical protein
MRWLSFIVIAAFLTAGALAQGDKPAEGTRPKDKDKKDKDKKVRPIEKIGPPRKGDFAVPVFTPQVEAAALKFAHDHHEKLAGLLEHLKAQSQDDYKRAIGELYRTSERLGQLKQRDRERYQLDLEVWQVDANIRLLAAQARMSADGTELREKLRAELLRKHRLQIARLELERQRAERRLKNLDEEIGRLKSQEEQFADKSVDQILQMVGTFKKADKLPKRKKGLGTGD